MDDSVFYLGDFRRSLVNVGSVQGTVPTRVLCPPHWRWGGVCASDPAAKATLPLSIVATACSADRCGR